MARILTWEQAISRAHQQAVEVEGVQSAKAAELGRALLDAENLAALQPKEAKPFYGAKARIRASLKTATAKDLQRVIAVASAMLEVVEAQEERADLALGIKAQLYTIWQADPKGQTFDEFVNSL